MCAIEGVAGLALEQVPDDDPELLGAALTLARRTGNLPGLRDLSNHLLAVGRVPSVPSAERRRSGPA